MIKTVILDKADRLYHFPLELEDYFPRRVVRPDEKKIRLIDLGHFSWPAEGSLPINDKNLLRPAASEDYRELQEALADWLRSTYGLKFDPLREIYIGQGIRRILFDVCLAYVEYGDIVFCPEPGIPFYKKLIISTGGVPVTYPISERTEFRPSARRLTSKLAKAAKLMILNNPHNPLGTVLDEADLSELIRIASRENMFIINDAAYSSLAEEKYLPLMSMRGSSKVGLEIFSIPFATGLPYLPFGFAIGAPEIINGLKIIGKSIGVYLPKLWIDQACQSVKAFPSPELKRIRREIDQSRIEARHLSEKSGWTIMGGNSVPFLWVKIPKRRQSAAYASTLLRRKRMLTLPGNSFGETAEGHLRLSLTAPREDYKEAIDRMSKRISFRHKKRE